MRVEETEVRKTAKTKTKTYDFAEQLRTREEMAAYLDAWVDQFPEDAAGIARALGKQFAIGLIST